MPQGWPKKKSRHSIHEDAGLILGLPHWVKDVAVATSCSISHRQAQDSMLLSLWHKPAAAALTQLLDWEFLYALGMACKKLGVGIVLPNI